MSFFDLMKKVVQGKPVFEVSEKNHQSEWQTPASQSTPSMTSAPAGPKVLPKVMIERIEAHMNGKRMDIYAHIKNESSVEVMLDKVRMLRVPRELDRVMRPHERREFLIYSGNRPNNDNDGDCEIQYRSMDGDYFTTLHDVQLVKQNDGTYFVTHIRYRGFRDI